MSRFHVDPSEKVDVYEFEPDSVISDTPPNVITIRARMDVATAGRVSSELMQLGEGNKIEAHLGSHVGALLLHNILSWRGPDFDDLPCTPANIRSLPSPESDPFIEKVANEIGRRNTKMESPNGRSPATASISARNGAADSTASAARDPHLPSANGTLRSPLLSAAIGRQSRSDD